MVGADITIDDFTPDDIGAFEELNLEWIRAHFEVEPTDLETLRDPQGKVLEAGGMARIRGDERLVAEVLAKLNLQGIYTNELRDLLEATDGILGMLDAMPSAAG